MMCGNKSYHPTLWRTCRVLAHEKRLACLKAVIEQPGGAVGEIAARIHTAKNQASLFLRALQARGLIGAQRQSRWVYYAPSPDPLVAGSDRLLSALKRALVDEKRPFAEVRKTLTGFTHPRRLVVLRRLSENPSLAFLELAVVAGISPPALSRHLKKLSERRLVWCDVDSRWRLATPPNHLAKTLLRLISEQSAANG